MSINIITTTAIINLLIIGLFTGKRHTFRPSLGIYWGTYTYVFETYLNSDNYLGLIVFQFILDRFPGGANVCALFRCLLKGTIYYQRILSGISAPCVLNNCNGTDLEWKAGRVHMYMYHTLLHLHTCLTMCIIISCHTVTFVSIHFVITCCSILTRRRVTFIMFYKQ